MLKLKNRPEFIFGMGNNLVRNVSKISRAIFKSDYQNKATGKKLVKMNYSYFF